MVPKIRDADKFKISDLSQKLKEVSDKCRNLKIDKKEFQGGSITITSLGGIGGTFFTPIINPPEVAILGIGKIFQKDKSENLYFHCHYPMITELLMEQMLQDFVMRLKKTW